jgi:glycolate oxidase FAD binding subunit
MIEGSAGAGVLYLRADAASVAVAEFVGALRGAIAGERCAVAVLAAPAGVRAELAGRGGMHGPVPGLALMRAVKDQFDPGHRMAPGRFPC